MSDNNDFDEKTDPLLIYCNAIIESIDDHNSSRPNKEMSMECIKIALKFNKLDLLTRWIAQKK